MTTVTRQKAQNGDLTAEYKKRVAPLTAGAPWLLRITQYCDKPVPVLVVKQRVQKEKGEGSEGAKVLKQRGLLYGQALRRCLPVIRTIISRVYDPDDIPLDLHRYLGSGRIGFRGNLPLNEEAGIKLALIFKLQERVLDMDRVELMAWRVERFSSEEAGYWFSRATQYGDAGNRWARAGMRLMLGGQPGDKAVQSMLERHRDAR